MSKHPAPLTFGLNLIVLLLCNSLAFAQSGGASSSEKMVAGLWEYTGLATTAGEDLPLTGVFLFKDGMFLQQAVFDGDPFDRQGAMAHAGPYFSEPDAVRLVAEQTISISPDRESPLSFRKNTEHDLTVSRSGDKLTLVFGSGTVQEFERIGPGKGEVFSLQDGALAFVDSHFILVHGNDQRAVTGYGTFEKEGDILKLDVTRWAEGDDSSAINRRDIDMQATFDGRSLILADGRRFAVVR